MFNSFLYTFLNIFHASIPVKYKSTKKKVWITLGIKASCNHKRSLCTFIKNSNDPKANAHCIKYCKILRKVITEAKEQYNL
jgi:hypothetical protein